jgi:hypothetical protein
MTRDDDRVAHLMGEPSGDMDDAERAALDDLRDLLADPAVWAAPDPALEGRVVAAISSEAAGGRVITFERPRQRRRVPGRVVMLAVASVAATVFAAVAAAGLISRRDAGPRFEVALAAVGPSRASGSATLTRTKSGWKVVLEAPGLPRLDAGRYYQAWLRSTDGTLVPIGSFNEGDDVTLWSGVSPVDYPGFTVTIEAADGVQGSSGLRVLAGTVDTSR